MLEWMPLHRESGAATVGGRSGVVYVEQCVICVVEQVLSGPFEEAMRWCAWAVMEAGYCVLGHARLFQRSPYIATQLVRINAR